MNIARRLSCLTLLLAVSASGPVAADRPKHPAKEEVSKKKDQDERLSKARVEILKKQVGLDEKKARETDKVLDRFAADRRKLEGDLEEARKTLRKLLEKKSDDQGAFAKALKSLRDTDKKLAQVRDDQFDAISKVLSPKEHAKLARATKQLQKKVREFDRERRDDDEDDFQF